MSRHELMLKTILAVLKDHVTEEALLTPIEPSSEILEGMEEVQRLIRDGGETGLLDDSVKELAALIEGLVQKASENGAPLNEEAALLVVDMVGNEVLDRLFESIEDNPEALSQYELIECVASVLASLLSTENEPKPSAEQRESAYRDLERLLDSTRDSPEAWRQGEAIECVASVLANSLHTENEPRPSAEQRGRAYEVLDLLLDSNEDNPEAWRQGEAIEWVALALVNSLRTENEPKPSTEQRERAYGVLERLLDSNENNPEAWRQGEPVYMVAGALADSLLPENEPKPSTEQRERAYRALERLFDVTEGNLEAWRKGRTINMVAGALANSLNPENRPNPSTAEREAAIDLLKRLIERISDDAEAWSQGDAIRWCVAVLDHAIMIGEDQEVERTQALACNLNDMVLAARCSDYAWSKTKAMEWFLYHFWRACHNYLERDQAARILHDLLTAQAHNREVWERTEVILLLAQCVGGVGAMQGESEGLHESILLALFSLISTVACRDLPDPHTMRLANPNHLFSLVPDLAEAWPHPEAVAVALSDWLDGHLTDLLDGQPRSAVRRAARPALDRLLTDDPSLAPILVPWLGVLSR
jgi:hypothetical protein